MLRSCRRGSRSKSQAWKRARGRKRGRRRPALPGYGMTELAGRCQFLQAPLDISSALAVMKPAMPHTDDGS